MNDIVDHVVRAWSDLSGDDYAGPRRSPASAGTAPLPAIVFPPDTRTRVHNTTAFPYQPQGQLIMQFPDGEEYSGTGTLIDRQHVLTAAHNVFGNDIGGWARNVWFAPARNGDVVPYGFLPASRLFITEDYYTLSPPDPNAVPVEDYTLYTEDYAVVRLRNPIDLSIFGMYAATDRELRGEIQITGYPGDKPEGTMWTDRKPLTGMDEHFLFYRINTYRGESGAAAVANLPLPIGYTIVGVHVAGDAGLDTNFGVRLDEAKIRTIRAWMNS
ncbi:trypsin-like serine peptidase [Sphingomonas sanxanigenens]|uniref:Serine protease n=1 Tax=Sphingomonas sanxanigenens DSM 19645 = NX02 TaxID=1123269 RepID=W0A6C5_9SPHN|nr:trypsin-like serine protease [Sphingomonas sanxanigenens]AHE51898.1 hypothetical protein NX02_00655 [Sphingomonas sanxanigenens DSM 19645 = NX02]